MEELSFVVLPGNRTRMNSPISTIIKSKEAYNGHYWFRDEEAGQLFPGYIYRLDEDHIEVFVLLYNTTMKSEIELTLSPDQPEIDPDNFIFQPIEIKKVSEQIIQVKRNGKPFSTLHINDALRPYFMPIMGPFGKPATREYPLKEIKDGSTDHIHHRSLWTGWGEVNGANHWDENVGVPQEVYDVSICSGGYGLAHIQMKIHWTDRDGEKPTVDETRDYFIYNTIGSETIMDVRVKFDAKYGPVKFGDTKEGGFMCVRVADSYRGSHGGRIENAYGMVGETEVWGKKAPWCDYSGIVDKQIVGITIMDHPENVGYPTYWHTRDYGLHAANPFGLSHFKNDKSIDGSYTLPANKTLQFTYRVFIHAGNAAEAEVEKKYRDFISPAELKFLEF